MAVVVVVVVVVVVGERVVIELVMTNTVLFTMYLCLND